MVKIRKFSEISSTKDKISAREKEKVKKFNKNQENCENFKWKSVEENGIKCNKAFCSLINDKCIFKNCPKINK